LAKKRTRVGDPAESYGYIDYYKLEEKFKSALEEKLPTAGLATEATLSALTSKLTPILKGSIFNTPVTANINIFSSDLSPTNSPTTFRIYACFNTGGVLTVRRTKAGTTVSEQLNSGGALSVNAAYMFDIMVESGETINLQYSVNATALKLAVYEVPSVIS